MGVTYFALWVIVILNTFVGISFVILYVKETGFNELSLVIFSGIFMPIPSPNLIFKALAKHLESKREKRERYSQLKWDISSLVIPLDLTGNPSHHPKLSKDIFSEGRILIIEVCALLAMDFYSKI